jgi:ribonucleoside-diphosphate reductase alpha chain
VEPIFQVRHTRRRKSINGTFIDKDGEKFEEYDVFHPLAERWLNDHPGEQLPDYFVEANDIPWQDKLKFIAAIQKNIDHSISNTTNLPKGTKPETIFDIYLEAWRLNLKGVTAYVDGSRSGVLVSKEDSDKQKLNSSDQFSSRPASKRPEELKCDIQSAKIKGEKWTVLVGLLNDRPYELFAGVSSSIEIPSKFKTGTIVKNRKKGGNTYDLHFGEDGIIRDIIKTFANSQNAVMSRLISLSLRHGSDVNFLVEQLRKDPEGDLTSFTSVVARVLKKYIPDQTAPSDKTCPECGEDTLRYTDGCVLCINEKCGFSKCG